MKVPKHLGVVISSGKKVYFPDDAVTQGSAILAKRRQGKSVLAGVKEEILGKRKHPFVIMDPAHAHWGIRYFAKANGQPGGPSGFEVLIVGGKRGDIPLDPKGGALLAEIVVETNISVIIDLKMTSLNARQGFVYDFATRLYELNETPRHLFFEEAHEFLPQNPRFENQQKVLGAMSRLVTGGGGLGLGFTLISQRPASVNKDVLTQIDNLYIMGMKGPQDAKAVKEWYEHNVGDKDKLKEIMGSLANLKPGQAWSISSESNEAELIQVRQRVTYHAGRTPKVGERPVSVRRAGVVQVSKKFTAIMQKREAKTQVEVRDLEQARARIAELNRELTARPKVVVEKRVIDKAALKRAVNQIHRQYQAILNKYGRRFKEIYDTVTGIRRQAGTVKKIKLPKLPKLEPVDVVATVESAPSSITQPPPVPYQANIPTVKYPPALPGRRGPKPPELGGPTENLPKGERAVLIALVQNPNGLQRNTISILAGYSRSTRDLYIQRLMTKGLVEANGSIVTATTSGINALGSDYERLPVGHALLEYWRGKLPSGEKRILNVVASQKGTLFSREVISERTGYSRSTRDLYIQRLGIRQLISATKDGVRASENLFD